MNDVVRSLPARRAQRRSMADRVRSSRRQGFVGRAEQRRAFTDALRGAPGAAQILLVHGPGGIGKSALLRRLADDAQEFGHTVVWLDGEQVGTSTTAFENAASPVHETERPALFVDGFEHCQALETWLREQFLPTVPEEAVVVVGGRQRPQPHWTLDPGWRDLVSATQLDPLQADEVTTLLDERGVPKARHSAVNGFAGGHPLALCLAADAAKESTSFDTAMWEPGPDVVETLLAQLIDRTPSAAHEYGLRVCGHVRHTTVDLLRTGLDEDEAEVVFDWLCALPYMEPGPHGLLPHELVRDVLDGDFAWRDPEAYAELHLRLWRHIGDRAQTASGDAVGVAVSELLYLNRYSDYARKEMFNVGQIEALFECPYSPGLREDVLRITRADQGDEQARLVAHWLDRRPEAFRVYCRATDLEPVAVLAWLRIHPDTDDFSADPGLDPIREHLDRRGGLRPNEHVGIARFLVPAPNVQHYTTASDLHSAQISIESLQQQAGLVASFLLLPDPDSFVDKIRSFDFHPLGPAPAIGSRQWGVFVHDWREVPLSAHLDRIIPVLGATPDPSDPTNGTAVPEIGKDEHDDAVRQALRDWQDDGAVAANPLADVYGDGAALRDAVANAVEALGADPRWVKHQRVVRATYLERSTTQEAAAAHLGIPFSTYRRHLRSAVSQVCEHLWSRHSDRHGEPS